MSSNQPISIFNADTIDLIAVWKVGWRYKYIVTAIASLFVVATVIMSLAATEIYRAEVVVVPTRESGASDGGSIMSQLGGLAGIAGFGLGSNGGDLDSLAVLESRHLLEEFIRRNDLVTELYRGSAEPSSLWLAVDRLKQSVVTIVTNVERATTTVSAKWRDPSIAADWANGIVALANDLIRARALDDSRRNIAYLNKQLEQTTVVELRRVLYNLIEVETQQVMLANARAEYAFTVVDPAVSPESRESPKRKLWVLTGGFVGLFLGLIVALVINAFRLNQQAGIGADS